RDAQDVFLAGLLHDIGKIGIPDHLLTKPETRMTAEERGVWRKHPIKGEQALMALEELRNAARLIRAHHERFDGQGYPDGASGLTIPLGARILSLANDYDGLRQGTLSDRRMDEQEAMQYVIQGKNRRYDPQVVDAFVTLSGGTLEPAAADMALSPLDLKPGMVLTRDFISREGVLLLAADYLLDENLIRQIRDYERSEGGRITLHVRPPENH
ncbi:MAG: HD domain-containing protein, partial [Betaproteobacteria bacterium]|nr:HD domain-containing protein [Betaproteobacteria bacterium]